MTIKSKTTKTTFLREYYMPNNLSMMNNSEIQEQIEKKSLKIAVIGIGRIGLPTALCFANSGFETIGVDINEKLVNMIEIPRHKVIMKIYLINKAKWQMKQPNLTNSY